jgi:protein-S-isoprenylcysteine O-methyltransferase Ste14
MLSTISPVVRVLLPVTGAVWATFELRQALQRRPEAKSADRGSGIAIRLSALIAAGGAAIGKTVPSATIGNQAVTGWIALVIMWCGIALRIWSFRTLGRYFTFTVQTSEEQPVISAGPYRVIRHPGYAGYLLAIVGIGVLINNWISLVVVIAAMAGGFIYRITVEERALTRDLGGRYQSYAESRKRLIPYIW